MNTLNQVKNFMIANAEKEYIKLLVLKDTPTDELITIRNYLQIKGMIHREDYEIDELSIYEVYVNALFHKHNFAKFNKIVESLSIIPITFNTNNDVRVVLSKNMHNRKKVKPLTINWGENFSVESAISSRIQEEFEVDVINYHKLEIDCDLINYFNVCSPNLCTNSDVKRHWTYYVAVIPYQIRYRPENCIKFRTPADFIKDICKNTAHPLLKEKLLELIKNI